MKYFFGFIVRRRIRSTVFFTVLALVTVVSAGCFFPDSNSKLYYAYDMFGLGFSKQDKLYLAHNLWYKKPMNISSLNFQNGKIIPFGTEVKFVEAKPGFIIFKIGKDKQEFKIINDKEVSDVNDKEIFNEIFTNKDPMDKFKNTDQRILENMKKGIIAKGMTREEIFTALGHGPRFLNPKSQTTWTYLINKNLKTIHVVFKDNKVSYVFTN